MLEFLRKKNGHREFVFAPDGQFRTKDYIADVLNEEMAKHFNMKYMGNYVWCGEWEKNRRKVIRLFLLKGDSTIFEWGYNFDFLPEIVSGKLQYFRTDKRIHIQLREMPKQFIDGGKFYDYRLPMHAADLDMLKEKISYVWHKTYPEIERWFSSVSDLDSMIDELDFQENYGKYYAILLPEKMYVKAFLLAKKNEKNLALDELKKTKTFNDMSHELQLKVITKLEGEYEA